MSDLDALELQDTLHNIHASLGKVGCILALKSWSYTGSHYVVITSPSALKRPCIIFLVVFCKFSILKRALANAPKYFSAD